jgi:hypothetical protein
MTIYIKKFNKTFERINLGRLPEIIGKKKIEIYKTEEKIEVQSKRSNILLRGMLFTIEKMGKM